MTVNEIVAEGPGIFLAIADPMILRTSVLDAIEQLSGNGKQGVIISVSEPQKLLKKALEKQQVDTAGHLFIDCVTASAAGRAGDEENCFYLNKCSDLTGMGIAVTKALSAVEDKENMFLILDSVSTMLIYSESTVMIRFLHMLINKVQLNEATGILFSAKNAVDPIVSSQITAFSDSVYHLEQPQE